MSWWIGGLMWNCTHIQMNTKLEFIGMNLDIKYNFTLREGCWFPDETHNLINVGSIPTLAILHRFSLASFRPTKNIMGNNCLFKNAKQGRLATPRKSRLANVRHLVSFYTSAKSMLC